MQSRSFLRSNLPLLLPATIGIIAFLAISGGRILNPVHVGWLTAGDPAQHYLGWWFFRNAPLLQNPLGANRNFGMELGSSIVYTDSLPLLAFLFKPFRSILPVQFQYMGWWMLLCFVLQAVLSWKLIGKFSSDRWVKLAGCGFFTMAPPFLLRMHGHESLMAHWLILAALLLYFSEEPFPLRWLILLVLGALVHAYLMLMVALLWTADRICRWRSRQLPMRMIAAWGILSLAILALVMWQTGYFMLSASSVQGGGYGFYRMNLLSPFHANGGWSVFMNGTEPKPGEDEGFNFLGIGGLTLVILAVGEWLRDRSIANGFRRVVPLAILGVLLTLYAASNTLAFGKTELLTIPLPRPLAAAASVYRASGRLFWPVFYLLYLGSMYVLTARYSPRMAAGILTVLLAAQISDCSGALAILHKKLWDRPVWTSSLQSPFWNAAAGRYHKILYMPPHNVPRHYFELCGYAAAHDMSINIGAFARTDPKVQAEMTEKLAHTLKSGSFEDDAIYIFEDGQYWKEAVAAIRPGDRAGVVDKFRLLAPGWSACASCVASGAFGPDGGVDAMLPYQMGTPIQFDDKGNAPDYTVQGFSVPEPWGTWTEGNRAVLAFRLNPAPHRDLNLTLANYAYVLPKHPLQRVEVVVNGHSLQTLSYVQPGAVETRLVKIPKAVAMERGGAVTIELLLPDAVTPSELGEPADLRRLALGMIWAVVAEIK
jgi:hypothetical protein